MEDQVVKVKICGDLGKLRSGEEDIFHSKLFEEKKQTHRE